MSMRNVEFYAVQNRNHLSRLQQNLAELITTARRPPKPNSVHIHHLGFRSADRFLRAFHMRQIVPVNVTEIDTGQYIDVNMSEFATDTIRADYDTVNDTVRHLDT